MKNNARRAGLPRASWILAFAALGGLLAALAIASGGSTTSAAAPCDAPTEPCSPGDRVINRQALTNKLFAVQVACDSCVLGGNPSPTATATASPTLSDATQGTTATATQSTSTPTVTGTASPVPTTATPTTTPDTGNPGGGSCTDASAIIIALFRSTDPEGITLFGSGPMNGWYLLSSQGGERFDFPQGYVLDGVVDIVSGLSAANQPPHLLLWSNAEIWSNSGTEVASLYDCEGTLRGQWEAAG